MELWLAVAFLLIEAALFFLLNPNPKDIEAILLKEKKKQTLKKMAEQKESRLRKAINNTVSMMNETGQSGKFYLLVLSSAVLLVTGAAIGIAIGNMFMVPVLAFGFASVPFLYIRFQYIKYYSLMIDELEVTLSTISLSYERTENILSAVEENIENIHPPVRQVFEEFVRTVRYVNPNMDAAVDAMKKKVNHSVFWEWCDALKRCAHNRGLKYTLRPIVDKLKEIKKASGRQQNILYKAKQSFWVLAGATVILLFVCLRVLPTGMDIHIPVTVSNLLIALNALVIIVAGIAVSIISRDIQFDL